MAKAQPKPRATQAAPAPAPAAPQDEDEYVHPLDAHSRREPLPHAGIRLLVLAPSAEPDRIAGEDVGRGLVTLIEQAGRLAELRVEPVGPEGMARAIERGLEGAALPLVLITTAREPWTEAHLAPLLAEIDRCDLVLGRRHVSRPKALARWLASRPWRILFATPLLDVHSPCRLHRLEPLRAIPLQSASSFVEVEMLAKSTFLTHVLSEVDVPPLTPAIMPKATWWRDFNEVFRRPVLARRAPGSGPAEEPQGQVERDDGPGRQDRQGGGDGHEVGPA